MKNKNETLGKQDLFALCRRDNVQTKIGGEPADFCQVQAVMSVCEHGCYMADFYADPETGKPTLNFDYVPYDKDQKG